MTTFPYRQRDLTQSPTSDEGVIAQILARLDALEKQLLPDQAAPVTPPIFSANNGREADGICFVGETGTLRHPTGCLITLNRWRLITPPTGSLTASVYWNGTPFDTVTFSAGETLIETGVSKWFSNVDEWSAQVTAVDGVARILTIQSFTDR